MIHAIPDAMECSDTHETILLIAAMAMRGLAEVCAALQTER